MRRSTPATILAFALSLGAAYVSFNLLAKHMNGSAGPSWFDAGCSDAPDSAANCGAVLASSYSYWPPKVEGEPEGTKHWPVALFGMFYYSALTVWFLAVGAPSRSRRYVQLIPIAFITCGLIGSIYFLYVMFTKLEHWCPWCVVTHGLNLVIAVMAVMMWPGKAAAVEMVETSSSERAGAARSQGPINSKAPSVPAALPDIAHPTFRLVLTGALAALMLVWGQYQLYDKGTYASIAMQNKTFFQQCQATVDLLKGDPANLVSSWKNAEPCEIPLRADDPARSQASPGEPTMNVVVFSDFECPSCRRFAIMFERDVQPLFDHKLTLFYRHHPLNNGCNPRVSTAMHPHSCDAAKLAEAARVLGGSDKFWLAHDHLFNEQSELERGKVNAEWLASRIGVNADELAGTMAAPDILDRINEDIDQATACKVNSTPTVFLDGKLVDSIPRNDIKFWDRVAHEFWMKSDTPRPAHTTLAVIMATRGSQGRPNGQ